MKDDVARIIGEAMIEIGQRLLGQARNAEPPAPARPQALPKQLMPVRAYARVKGVSEGTLRTWIKAGMPTVPAKRGVRVNVPAAEEWIQAGGAKLALTARPARLDA